MDPVRDGSRCVILIYTDNFLPVHCQKVHCFLVLIGPLGGPGVEREHVQVPRLRAGEPPASRLPASRCHIRRGRGHRAGTPAARLPAQVRLAS
jgi:hypothetical protein